MINSIVLYYWPSFYEHTKMARHWPVDGLLYPLRHPALTVVGQLLPDLRDGGGLEAPFFEPRHGTLRERFEGRGSVGVPLTLYRE